MHPAMYGDHTILLSVSLTLSLSHSFILTRAPDKYHPSLYKMIHGALLCHTIV